jgi:hypothetical protein
LSLYSSSTDQTSSSPSRHSIANPRKTTSGKFWAWFNVRIKTYAFLSWYSSTVDQTSSSPSSYVIATPRKTASGKLLAWSNGRIKIYGPFESILKFDWPDIPVTE